MYPECLLLRQRMGLRADVWASVLALVPGTTKTRQGNGIENEAPSCLQVKSAKCTCEGVGGEKRKASTAQRCTDIRT